MQPANITFVYLDLDLDLDRKREFPLEKNKPMNFLELQYSLATLLAEVDEKCSIVVYTNKPDRYSSFPVEIENIADIVPKILGEFSYIYRAKPWVLLDSLRKRGGICVYLDSDTFIFPGFFAAISEKVASSAVMHDVYWGMGPSYGPSYIHAVTKPFPNQRRHKESPSLSFGGNSGVIGLSSGLGESILEDAIYIIDQMLPTKNWNRTLEQHAIAEAIWLHGVPVDHVRPWIFHYYRNSQKRYMHFQINRLLKMNLGSIASTRPCIKINNHRVKLYQYFYTMCRSMHRLTIIL
jgi:hypothetical protein